MARPDLLLCGHVKNACTISSRSLYSKQLPPSPLSLREVGGEIVLSVVLLLMCAASLHLLANSQDPEMILSELLNSKCNILFYITAYYQKYDGVGFNDLPS